MSYKNIEKVLPLPFRLFMGWRITEAHKLLLVQVLTQVRDNMRSDTRNNFDSNNNLDACLISKESSCQKQSCWIRIVTEEKIESKPTFVTIKIET